MLALAQGQSDWLHPTVWGQTLPLDAPLAYWMGAWAIGLAPNWLSAGSAARIPFALLLALTMFSTWKAAYYLDLVRGHNPLLLLLEAKQNRKTTPERLQTVRRSL